MITASRQELESQLFDRLDELETREAQLELIASRIGASPSLLVELERVRLEISFHLETLDDIGAFNPPDDAAEAPNLST